jgi:hypothetical protein
MRGGGAGGREAAGGSGGEGEAQIEAEAQADRRYQRDERQCNNQPDKRCKSGTMRGTGRWEAVV